MEVTIITKYILDDFKSLTGKEKPFISYLKDKDNISFNELPEDIQNSFSKIPKINKIYKCKKCGKNENFHQTEKQYAGDLFITVECEENHTFKFDYWYKFKFNRNKRRKKILFFYLINFVKRVYLF